MNSRHRETVGVVGMLILTLSAGYYAVADHSLFLLVGFLLLAVIALVGVWLFFKSPK